MLEPEKHMSALTGRRSLEPVEVGLDRRETTRMADNESSAPNVAGNSPVIPDAEDEPEYGYAIDGKHYTLESREQFDFMCNLTTAEAKDWLEQSGKQPTGTYDTTGKLKAAKLP